MKISECTLSKETQDLLYRYFAAAANLYGVIEIGKLLEIYNSQNEPVSEEDFLSFVENMNFKGKYFFMCLIRTIFTMTAQKPLLLSRKFLQNIFTFLNLMTIVLINTKC